MTDALEQYRLLIADVYELAGISRRTSEDIAREAGQTAARWHVLSVLSDGPRTVPNAARRLGLTPQSVQRVVGDLLAAGQAEAVPNPDHARSPLIALTDEGRDTLERLFARSEAARERLLTRAGTDAEELRQATETLRRLLDVLRTPG
ncbi:MarR family winged helix-turn-helix transcriptional regulator [Amycolatopsis sp. 195334CR]|uniref:MarR family winged helix-turn-helix transcriptional regulator n=1 Tax=Amycolatopsis sp. 195334CR TaxID=2814588 RepID=UPI001A8C310E|nr:MarR family winged helix-turn-helix transcriptional regulator [Amycolatopsis sp. 195334CR]MBN6041980.1 winged helix-turn-helix transcriptional regulator [Amycolatopsis sp. 195334CR]